MADDRQSASAAGGAKGYKRSWKNLLINKRYQLRFTLFMVGVSAMLMTILAFGEDLLFFTDKRTGERWWVVAVADDATKVAASGKRGNCGDPIPEMFITPDSKKAGAPIDESDDEEIDEVDEADLEVEGDDDPIDLSGEGEGEGEDLDEATPVEPAPPDKGSGAATGSGSASGSGSGSGSGSAAAAPVDEPDPGEGRHNVVVEESSMTITEPPTKPPEVNPLFLPGVAAHYECELRKAADLDDIQDGRSQILWVLLACCLGMVVGLGIYGIKMTHKVAGPLYKVTLYMAKMRDGRLDRVYNLRKGDELVAFYEHFKVAHSGVVDMEKADIARLKALITAAKTGDLADKSPELKAAILELETALARKEKSIE